MQRENLPRQIIAAVRRGVGSGEEGAEEGLEEGGEGMGVEGMVRFLGVGAGAAGGAGEEEVGEYRQGQGA